MSDTPETDAGVFRLEPTPETDRAVKLIEQFDPTSSRHVMVPYVRVDFARRLERERDEARGMAEQLLELAEWIECEPWQLPWINKNTYQKQQ